MIPLLAGENPKGLSCRDPRVPECTHYRIFCEEGKVDVMMEGEMREEEAVMGRRALPGIVDGVDSLDVEREREERRASKGSPVLFGCDPESSIPTRNEIFPFGHPQSHDTFMPFIPFILPPHCSWQDAGRPRPFHKLQM